MTAILKREFASYFTSPLGYVYLAVFYGFSGLFLWITCLTSGSADMQYVFLWMFFIMMIRQRVSNPDAASVHGAP